MNLVKMFKKDKASSGNKGWSMIPTGITHPINMVILKEMQVLLRNPMVMLGLFLPLLLVPVMLFAYNAISDRTEAVVQATASPVAIIVEMIDKSLTKDEAVPGVDARLASLPEPLAKQLSDLVEQGKVKFVAPEVAIDSNGDQLGSLYKSILDQTGAQAVLVIKESGPFDFEFDLEAPPMAFELWLDTAQNSGREASDRVQVALRAYGELVKKGIVNAANLSEQDAKALEAAIHTQDLELVNGATEKEAAGRSISNYAPLVLMLYALTLISTFALELTTAEKESGTLETMFSVPVSTTQLVMGKMLACNIFSVMALALTLGGLALMMPLGQVLGMQIDANVLGMTLSPGLMLSVFVAMVPMLLLMTGMMIGAGMFASSYKESGAYITPLMFMFMIPAYVGSAPGLELTAGWALVPVVNATLLIKAAFINQINWGFFAIVFAVNTLLAVISLVFAFKSFATESLIFGSGKQFSFRIKRSLIKATTYLEAQDAMLIVAAATLAYIYINLLMSNTLGFLGMFLASQYGAFALLPILAIWFLKADLFASLSMKRPDMARAEFLKQLGIGVAIWAVAFGINIGYSLVLSQYVTEVPTLAGLEDFLNKFPVWIQFVLISVTPGICEEILFRGVALKALEQRYGASRAMVITSVLFALIHLDVTRLVPTFLLGLALSRITLKTKSIYPAMALHVINNGIAFFWGR